MTDLLAAADEVVDVVMANADEAERIRRLPAATVAALVDGDLMRMALASAPTADRRPIRRRCSTPSRRSPAPTAPPGGAR